MTEEVDEVRVQDAPGQPVARPTGRHHRRSRTKRFLLATGPFFFLAAAVMLSAGVVQIIEQPPSARPGPTLAEERAAAERLAGATEATVESPATASNRTLPPAMLADPNYDLEHAGAGTLAGRTTAAGEVDSFSFALPQNELDPDMKFAPYPASSRYYGLQ